ncbi:GNAT family N-acetyltransferase [Proteiniphilum sp. UBA1028]|jgi:GNAT superfamily N-acetyltransferase|uniref:GNAT family N-acetyltransferase n=1 Tax=Proteiniphilum sp. UBA1028 TaxID=1947251 RepID=UPI000E8F8EE1|nr:GNAT family N-acetyltransferase [Proteiniphilum sp. UBA1028]HBG59130.1 N-acetyltransferase [Porphyromonadaceae bacterium]HCF80339.1 N-acetyltransferase [Porphyromonadaceae bacterium]
MEFLQIIQNDTESWNKVWKLYEESFPVAERRKVGDHLLACGDDRFSPLSAWEGEELIGLMFFWEWDSYRYLEHLAVNPLQRGRGYGSQLLKHLRDSAHTIILEIDPLSDEQSVRRLQFYERAGYTLTPYRFVHLPYRLDTKAQELLILSYPDMITKEQHDDFLHFVNEEVIQYCEKKGDQ